MLDTIRKLASKTVLDSYDLSYLDNPEYGGWRLEKDACQFIGKYCETFKPRRVLEFGSGLSTLILAHEASRGNVEKVWSIDHMLDFPGHPAKALTDRGNARFVMLHRFPITLRYSAGKLFQFYKIPRSLLREIVSLDLLIIDGPPYFFNGREAALYVVHPLLTRKALVIMDDARRKNREQAYLGNWRYYYGRNIETVMLLKQFRKGLACVRITGHDDPITPFPLRQRLGDSWAAMKRTFLAPSHRET